MNTTEAGRTARQGFQQSNRPVPELHHDPFAGSSVPMIDAAKVAPTTGPASADNLPMPTVNGEPIVKPGEMPPKPRE